MKSIIGGFFLICASFFIGIFSAALLSLISGLIVWFLWNNFVHDFFNMGMINFWQAWGLSWLCSVLFKSHVSVK